MGLIVPVVALAGWGGTSGGVVKSEKRSVSPFRAIRAAGMFEIMVILVMAAGPGLRAVLEQTCEPKLAA